MSFQAVAPNSFRFDPPTLPGHPVIFRWIHWHLGRQCKAHHAAHTFASWTGGPQRIERSDAIAPDNSLDSPPKPCSGHGRGESETVKQFGKTNHGNVWVVEFSSMQYLSWSNADPQMAVFQSRSSTVFQLPCLAKGCSLNMNWRTSSKPLGLSPKCHNCSFCLLGNTVYYACLILFKINWNSTSWDRWML